MFEDAPVRGSVSVPPSQRRGMLAQSPTPAQLSEWGGAERVHRRAFSAITSVPICLALPPLRRLQCAHLACLPAWPETLDPRRTWLFITTTPRMFAPDLSVHHPVIT